jgi:hypothetical protein
MGAVAAAVGNAVGDAFDFIGDAVEMVGDITLDAVEAVGDAVVWVGDQVGQMAEAAANDPVGTIAKVAAVASGQWWALPLVSAGLVIANGGDIGQAALAAGISLAAQGVAYGVGEALGSAGSGISDMMATDAASMSASGLSASQIADTLASSYGVAADIASTTADLASMGLTASQIAADLGSTYGSQFAAEVMTPQLQNTLANVAANTAGSGVRAAGSGGDLEDVLAAMGTAGLGTAVSAGTTSGLKDLGAGSKIAGTVGAATGAAAATAASGKDGTAAFLNSLINTTLAEGGKQSKAYLKQSWDKLNNTVGEYNAQLTKTEALRESNLTPLEKEAKDAEAAVNAELAAYKPVRDKFSDLVTQYDAAKAAGNVALANSLAKQANDLIPELNTATEKYNDVYNNYEAKLNDYKTGVEAYKQEIQKTDQLKENYTKTSEELAAETQKLTAAADKVVKMSEPVAQAFTELYKNGEDVDFALEKANQLNSMSATSQEFFNRQYGTTQDLDASFEFANKVNSLGEKEQNVFSSAAKYGIDTDTAFEIAPAISSFDPRQQAAYINALKEGYGAEGADLIAAFASFAGPETITRAPLDIKQSDQYKELESMFGPEAANAWIEGQVESIKSGKEFAPLASTSDTPLVESSRFFNRTYWDDNAKQWVATPGQEVETGGMDTSGLGTGQSVTGKIGPALTAEDLKDYYEAGEISKSEYDTYIQKLGATPDPKLISPTIQDPTTMDWLNSLSKNKTTPAAPSSVGPTPGTPGVPSATAPVGGAGTGQPIPGGAVPGAPAGASPGTTAGTGTGTTSAGTGTVSGGFSLSGTGGTGFGGGYTIQGQDQYGGIKNLTPGLTERMDYNLAGLPTDVDAINPMTQVPTFATGGSTSYDPFSTNTGSSSGISGALTPGLSKAQINYILTGLPGNNVAVPGKAEGGSIEGHNPEFYSEGGLSSMENRYVEGEGDGTSDEVPAMLANGEFVIPADVVSKLGNGSNEAGAGVLDQFLSEIRKHAHSNGEKLPPDSKGPLGYLLDAKRKVKA